MSFAARLIGISKSFGAVRALRDVTLDVRAGTISALVGENGAGKTTLMRVLYGVHQPDSGRVEVDGRPVRFYSSADAADAGIGMVSQHYGIIGELTCLQNLILGSEERAVLHPRELALKAEELAVKMGFRFDWNAEASSLSPASTQKLEILKLLWRRSELMILDEPTAMLSPVDADALFQSLHALVDEGATVILVTHRLPEVIEQCAFVTVLRNGEKVADMAVADTNPRELANLIVGKPVEQGGREPSSQPVAGSKPMLSIKSATLVDERGHAILTDLSLEIRPGELVGIAGVDGNGQRELLQAVLGSLSPAIGSVEIDGQGQMGVPPSARLRNGLRVIPEDRHREAIIEAWPIEENCALGLQRLPPIGLGNQIDLKERRILALRVLERFHAKHGGINLPLETLSGGNQQRIVVARALELSPRLLVAFQPARGLDLGATADVYRTLRQLCEDGLAALVISFDLDELLEHCDRVVVLNAGKAIEPTGDDSMSREAIGLLMVGAN